MGADSQKPEAASERQPLVNAAFAPRPPAGADLQNPSPDLLLWAYGHGVFPMGDPESGRLEWFSPDPRGIIPLHPSDAFQIPKNLAREVRKNRFEIRTDAAFEQVMRGCATDRGGFNRSWINETIIRTYCQLHQMGHAHSVEAWVGGALVGGLYGVQIGGAFFGESMFSRSEAGGSNSSKVCLVHLVQHLRALGFTLLDTQFWNEHLDQFGCIEIPAAEYLGMLQSAMRLPVVWGTIEPATR